MAVYLAGLAVEATPPFFRLELAMVVGSGPPCEGMGPAASPRTCVR